MSDLRPQVRTAIQNILGSQTDHQTASDVLRVIEEEAMLMKETQEIVDTITSDPFEQFDQLKPKPLERFKAMLQVQECDRIRTGADHARIHAVVEWPACNQLELTFSYERKPRQEGAKGCHVRYSIDLSHNHGQRERLLEVQVWAPTNVPSAEPAICIQEAFLEKDDNDWEDISDSEDVSPDQATSDPSPMVISPSAQDSATSPPPQAKKKQKTTQQDRETKNDKDNEENDDRDMEEEPTRDQFIAFLDPDVLSTFLESTGLAPMTEGTAFFLLMTFPFYEHEWDLVGFVLDTVFGGDSDDEDNGDDDPE